MFCYLQKKSFIRPDNGLVPINHLGERQDPVVTKKNRYATSLQRLQEPSDREREQHIGDKRNSCFSDHSFSAALIYGHSDLKTWYFAFKNLPHSHGLLRICWVIYSIEPAKGSISLTGWIRETHQSIYPNHNKLIINKAPKEGVYTEEQSSHL